MKTELEAKKSNKPVEVADTFRNLGKGARFQKGHRHGGTTCVSGKQDGSKFWTGGKDCAIIEWDPETLQKTVWPGKRKNFNCGGHFEAVLSCAWNEKAGLLATVGIDQLVRLWDPRDPKGCVKSLRGHTKTVTCVVSNPNTNQVLSIDNRFLVVVVRYYR